MSDSYTVVQEDGSSGLVTLVFDDMEKVCSDAFMVTHKAACHLEIY